MGTFDLVLWGIVIVCICMRALYVMLTILKKNNDDDSLSKITGQDILYFVAGYTMYIAIIILCVKAFIA